MFYISELNRLIKINNAKDVYVSGVSIDSRTTIKGDIFVAIKGKSFDGHDFTEKAYAKGAVAVITEKDLEISIDIPTYTVDSTKIFLGQLANWWRNKFHVKLIAITGSNGKTSVKEMVAQILISKYGKDKILFSEGNYNNEIGVPLTLLKLNRKHNYSVIEMGMNNPGEITRLSKMAAPNVALINNIGSAHIGNFNSQDEIADAKLEIITGLKENGILILNRDDNYHDYFLKKVKTKFEIFSYGFNENADLKGIMIDQNNKQNFNVSFGTKKESFELKIPGLQNHKNSLAAIAICSLMGMDFEEMKDPLKLFRSVRGRLEEIKLNDNLIIINDSYNSNPESALLALDFLSKKEGKKIFFMGDMGELGKKSQKLHDMVVLYALEVGIDCLISKGDFSKKSSRLFDKAKLFYSTFENLFIFLNKERKEKKIILIKGSRFMKMESLIDEFTKNYKCIN